MRARGAFAALLTLGASVAQGAGPAACEATVGVPFGALYKPATVRNAKLGRDLVVEGRVRSAADCRALPHARVEHWQAGRDGRYTEALRAYQLTDRDGRFRFVTEWPGHPPPHIHFRVDAPGHGTLISVWKQAASDSPVRRIELDFVLEPR